MDCILLLFAYYRFGYLEGLVEKGPIVPVFEPGLKGRY